MESIKNEYQLTKTLRFGLTQKEKTRKEGFTGEIYKSHKALTELIKISEERIKKSVSADTKSELDLSVDDIQKCLVLISDYLSNWQQFYRRSDQITLDRDYYNPLAELI